MPNLETEALLRERIDDLSTQMLIAASDGEASGGCPETFPAALADLGLLFPDFRQQVRDAPRVLLIVRRVSIDLGFDGGTRQGLLLCDFCARGGEATV